MTELLSLTRKELENKWQHENIRLLEKKIKRILLTDNDTKGCYDIEYEGIDYTWKKKLYDYIWLQETACF